MIIMRSDDGYNLKATLVETTGGYILGIMKEGYMALLLRRTCRGNVPVYLGGGAVPFVVRKAGGGRKKKSL
jgi:hypothetical protein